MVSPPIDFTRDLTPFIKLFIFAILFEPLLYFIFIKGLPFSRMLQLAFLIIAFLILVVLILNDKKLMFKFGNLEKNNPLNLFFLMIPISFFVGYFSGNHSVDLNIYQLNDFSGRSFEKAVSRKLLIEFLILIYYFMFFYFFTYAFLNKKNHFEYFFSLFKFIFILNLVLGYLDYIFNSLGIDLISRHFYDGVDVGRRFHGISGEPRQASVFLALGLSLLYLESLFKSKKFNIIWIFITLPALFLTISFTSLLSIFIFLMLLLPILISILIRRPIVFIFSIIFIFISTFYFVQIPRIAQYVETFSNVFEVLENNQQLPYLIRVQMGEVFPVYDQLKAISENNYMQFLFGSGIGTSAVNNYSYVDIMDAFGNPNSQLIRSIYESGFIGSILFISIFYFPFINKNIDSRVKINLYIFTSFVLAFSLGVRSANALIYLGILSSLISNNHIKMQ
mgnify:CR=1 FL=1|tara:strand:+ start:22397 stop:23743 length:1347 start_codon:yes stop_codon:yes gene_type:complete